MIEAKTASGLAAEMQSKEDRMSVLGSEAISKQGRYIASAKTAMISSKAESSILTTLAMSLSDAFSEILTFMLDWDDNPNLEVDVNINYDIFNDPISSQELVQFMKVWQSGGISNETYFNLLEKREAYPEGWNMQEEIDSIRESMSGLYDLDESKFIELTARMDKLALYTKQMESGAIASLVASGMSDELGGVEGAEKIKQFEEGIFQETPPAEESEENVENN